MLYLLSDELAEELFDLAIRFTKKFPTLLKAIADQAQGGKLYLEFLSHFCRHCSLDIGFSSHIINAFSTRE
jgi:hypothetical protein